MNRLFPRARLRAGRRRAGVVAVAAASTLLIGVAPAGAVVASKPAAPVAPAPVDGHVACDLTSSAHQTHDEFASCVGVSAELDRAPSVGETALLTVGVTSQVSRPAATVTIELPPTLEAVAVPAPLVARAARSFDGIAAVTHLVSTFPLAADRTLPLAVLVRAVDTGPGQVRARAVVDVAPGEVQAGQDHVFLTVAPAGEVSRFAIDVPAVGGVAPVDLRAHPMSPNPTSDQTVPIEGARTTSATAPQSSPSAPGQSCVTGSWNYIDVDGNTRPSANYSAQAWDQDAAGGDDVLAVQGTTSAGSYHLCFPTYDDEGGLQEVYVRFVSDNTRWRVEHPTTNQAYAFGTGVVAVGDGATHNFGSLQPSDTGIHRHQRAYAALNQGWQWTPKNGAGCWDVLDTSDCWKVVLNWAPDATVGSVYRTGEREIYMPADDPNSTFITLHELGHAVMHDVYDGYMPPNPDCQPHFNQVASSLGCAWTEGFATWFASMVVAEPVYRWEDGSSLDLENRTWNAYGWHSGETVEGRVAGALIDIADPAGEVIWDRYGEGHNVPGHIWTTLLHNRSDTFAQFWQQRAGRGYDTSDAGAKASVYQNTIDFTFRDPLAPYRPLVRPDSRFARNFQYTTSAPYWSVVAIRPASSTVDVDLTMYDDVGQTRIIRRSDMADDTVDFIAVDTNHRAPQTYYPSVDAYNTDWAAFTIQLSYGNQVIGEGALQFTAGADDLGIVRDLYLSPGVPTQVRVVPLSGTHDVDLFVMESDPDNYASLVQNRSDAAATAASFGPGGAEQLTYTSADGSFLGLVVTSEEGTGSYKLFVDSSAPAGELRIDGGAVQSNDHEVVVDNAMTDVQSGVVSMRHSVDGTLDTERWVPYDYQTALTLPPGDGPKTVIAAYRNEVGMVAARSDDIVVDTTVSACTISGTVGDDVLSGTPGSDVICGFGGNDRIDAGLGDDRVHGGDGADTIHGSGGTDVIHGDGGDDVLDGGVDGCCDVSLDSGNDHLVGGPGHDILRASDLGDNRLVGEAGGDTLHGSNGADSLYGGDDFDYLHGGAGNDVLHEGLAYGGGLDELYGGGGVDVVTYAGRTAGVTVTIDDQANDGAAGEHDNVYGDVENLTGGSGPDFLRGTDGNNTLLGGPGNDILYGGLGNDMLTGGTGSDKEYGEAGNDRFDQDAATNGADALSGGSGIDTATYKLRSTPVRATADGVGGDGAVNENDNVGADIEALHGGAGNDVLTGGAGASTLYGNGGDDVLDGGAGPDRLDGGAGNDTESGGTGNDTFVAGPVANGGDILVGDADADTVDYSARTTPVGVTIDADANDGASGESDRVDAETILGGTASDRLTGAAANETLVGNGGDDVLVGGDGADTLRGGDGADQVFGGSGADLIEGGLGNDVEHGDGDDDEFRQLAPVDGADAIHGGAGVGDAVTYASRNAAGVDVVLNDLPDDGRANEGDNVRTDVEKVTGSALADTLVGSAAGDTLIGGGGADSLYGLGGDDVLVGGAGADSVFGGDGDDRLSEDTTTNGGDRLSGGGGADTVSYAARSAAVRVSLDDVANDGATAEYDDVRTDVETVVGGNGGDRITGSANADVLLGGGGADYVDGLGGNDVVDGGIGDDRVFGGVGHDRVVGGAGVDRLAGGDGDDVLDLVDGAGGDVGDGGNHTDTCTTDGGDTVSACEG